MKHFKLNYLFTGIVVVALGACAAFRDRTKPVLYIIGDSTVKNGQDRGDGGLWGWGHFLPDYFNKDKITVENHALGGTSSRTFRSKGLWDSVLVKLKPGDYVIMQFGHNDSGPLDDTARARGTIHGNGPESKEIYNPILKKKEVVHTYGWYLRQYISEAKAKGATPVVCSMIPRNSWSQGRVNRTEYVAWAKAAAEEGGACFIDLNRLIADAYDRQGEEKVKTTYFGSSDHTHTILAGAQMNAAKVVEGIRQLNCTDLKTKLK